jgi:hypothetical protein
VVRKSEMRKLLAEASSTPLSRAKDWCMKWLAIIGGSVLVIWLLTYLSNK